MKKCKMSKHKVAQYYLMLRIIRIMKLTTILLLIATLQVLARDVYSQYAKLNLDLGETTVGQVLKEIENQSEFYFLFNQKLVDVDRKVNIRITGKKVNEILEQVFNGTDIEYAIIDRQIVLSPSKYLKELNVRSQTITISGLVTDEDGLPLGGVSIYIKGTTTGTTTDVNGNYSFEVPSEDVVLIFSSIGYIREEIQVGSRREINMMLIPEITELEEIIVVGYGTQSKKVVTGSVQYVDAEDLTDIPVTSVTQKLQGKLAGVQINQTTGKPGQGMQVRIRGQASLTAGNEPLYVIDGFPVSGDLSLINPNEIESISILKDASSTALYGSRAANGVVMITTKKAKPGKTAINVSAYYGVQQVPQKGRPEMMNGTEFAQFKKESYEDLGLDVPEAFQNPSQYGEGYNYYDAILRNAAIQEYNVSLSTSKENFSTTAVVGFLNQEGVVLNSDYSRYSLRINSDFKVTDKISTGLKIAPSFHTTNTPSTDGIFWSSGIVTNSLLTWPIFPYRNEDGTIPLMSWDPTISTFPTPNYYRAVKEITNETKRSRILTNGYLQYEPVAGLTLKTTFNFDYGISNFDNINPSTASNGFIVVLPTTASAVYRNSNYFSWLNENTVTYSKSYEGHNIEALGGFSIQKYRSDTIQTRVTGFPDDRVPTISAADNIDRSNDMFGNPFTYDGIQEWSMMSYIGRINYNYKNKYLLSAAIRADGSSRFGVDNRWGTFPSISGGWIASDENFMKDLGIISFLKLRASYGIVGNNNIGNYTQYATVRSGSSSYNSIFGSELASGSAVISLPNSELTWEKTAEYDLGLDIGFFDNKLNIGYDYYNRKSKSLLYSVNVAQESGFGSFKGNIGELQFWGHEITISSINLSGAFKWNTDFNIAFTDNEVLELYGDIDRIYSGVFSSHITKKGERIGLFYGMVWDGVYDNQEEFDNSPKAIASEVGTIKFKDVNEDGVITYGGDDDDRTIIGDPTPAFTFGMTNNFFYKGFDLSIVLSGSYGNDIANLNEQGLCNLDGVFNVLKEVENRWRSEADPGDGKYGKTTSGTSNERDWVNSRFISDGSFISIRNVSLGYTVPLNKAKRIESLRFYVSAQQLYIFTKYKGVNPEISMDAFGNVSNVLNLGNDWGGYPVPRTISFGMNLNL
jgi:TonB-linked SusC/RagA family outer membrane protein